jgi:O-antigen biosynthesis protein
VDSKAVPDLRPPSDYYEHARVELLDLVPAAPRGLLDVGCGSGATAALAKSRWPATYAVGVEYVADAAGRARERLDLVVEGSIESLDLAVCRPDVIDTILLADVLEHLVDPWTTLARLRDAFPAATVVASIPNIANLWLIEELAAGRFPYADEGLLDVTHLRFFTRASIAQMFAGAGYRIDRWERVTDGRVDDLTRHRVLGIMLPPHVAGRVTGRRVALRSIDAEHYDDLRTIQFLLVARPANSSVS